MNMILHDFPTANIASGGEGTLVEPRFLNGEQLRTYDYVVANPPFSDKTWSTGLTLGESGEGDRSCSSIPSIVISSLNLYIRFCDQKGGGGVS